jgi:uncharacterized protein
VQLITADTNIYVSALIWGGKPLQLLESSISEEIRLMISDDILNEILTVIRDKFKLTDERLRAPGNTLKAALSASRSRAG